jgi:hypothetical protein
LEAESGDLKMGFETNGEFEGEDLRRIVPFKPVAGRKA